MQYTKTIVCFANSRKTSGRCVAGKTVSGNAPGPWFRPVSARATHEISLEERRYQDGSDPQLLDVLMIPCEAPQPLPYQPENHLIDADYYWEREGSLSFTDVDGWLDQPAILWGSGHSGYAFENNRIPEGTAAQHSLYLIRVDSLNILVGPKSADYPKRIVRGQFHFAGVRYCLSVTDPAIEASYLARDNGTYTIRRPALCVSLGDPYQGYFYKLIAAVLHAGRF
jgi:hypothetical protein